VNPFDLRGPEFLGFYFVVFLLGLIAAFILRWWLRTPGDAPRPELLDLSPYEVAYLKGGPAAAIDAALVRLIHRNILAIDASERRLTIKSKLPTGATHLEQVLYGAAGENSGALAGTVRRKASTTAEKLRARLERFGLLVTQERALLARLLPGLVVWLVALIGLIKIFVGMSRNRPVGFLVLLVIVTVMVGIAFLAKKPLRSRRGDRALSRLQVGNAALRYSAGRHVSRLADDDLLMALGLFGTGVLAGGPLASLPAALRPPPAKSGGWSSGSSCGSCGSSSCGGGGCGGGCGGGGCGGCGS
jgi:uncharacterized protein (TIGR04222 family)